MGSVLQCRDVRTILNYVSGRCARTCVGTSPVLVRSRLPLSSVEGPSTVFILPMGQLRHAVSQLVELGFKSRQDSSWAPGAGALREEGVAVQRP